MEVRDIFRVTSVGAASSTGLKSRLKEEIKASARHYGVRQGMVRTGRSEWIGNLEGATLGYTKNAQAYFTQELQKEYTY